MLNAVKHSCKVRIHKQFIIMKEVSLVSSQRLKRFLRLKRLIILKYIFISNLLFQKMRKKNTSFAARNDATFIWLRR